MKFKAPHKKSFYKSELAWLKAVYKRNKGVIDATLGIENGKGYKPFKKLVMEMKQDKYLQDKYGKKVTTRQAVIGLGRTEIFTPVAERLKENALSALKKDKEMFKELRRRAGWKQKIRAEDFEWSQSQKGYIYRTDNPNDSVGSWLITYTSTSPVRMKLVAL